MKWKVFKLRPKEANVYDLLKKKRGKTLRKLNWEEMKWKTILRIYCQ
jgi:hypothetical protein